MYVSNLCISLGPKTRRHLYFTIGALMIAKPEHQQSQFLKWFADIGVYSFDVQLRVPNSNHQWTWLPAHKNVSIGYYFLKLARWGRYMNSKGGDLFLRPHGEVAHSVLFLDDLPVDKAMRVADKYSACVICTSENNTQVWLATDRKLCKDQRKEAQSFLRDVGYTDPGSISGDHLGRFCGVKSQKRNCWVNLLTASHCGRYSPILPPNFSCPVGQACVSSSQAVGPSQSEQDFGWVIGMLKSGVSAREATERLEAKALHRNKRNPTDYAKRTIMKALQVLNRPAP